MAIFVGRTMRFFRVSQQFKTAFYHELTKSLKQVQKDRSYFSQVHIIENAVGAPKNLLYLQLVFERYALRQWSPTLL